MSEPGEQRERAPVLGLIEVAEHPHIRDRGTMVDVAGVSQPAPAPRFSRTPSEIRHAAGEPEDARAMLARWGLEETEMKD